MSHPLGTQKVTSEKMTCNKGALGRGVEAMATQLDPKRRLQEERIRRSEEERAGREERGERKRRRRRDKKREIPPNSDSM
eukprot:3930064-Pyramimonas_sp.AAC.1